MACLTVVLAASVSVMGAGAAARAAAPPPTPPPTAPAPTPFVHPAGVHNPDCVIEIQPGDSLSIIADEMPDTAVTYFDLAAENGISNADAINAGAFLDICVGNQVNDITGSDRVDDGNVEIVDELVAAQQRKLNQLFAGLGIDELLVDGISGPLTRRQLCAFRSAFGLPISRADMVPGSDEERVLIAVTALPTQSGAPERWVLVDKTCQVMFAGSGNQIVHLWPASTGEAGWETRDQAAVRAFRYDPASDNDGWHNSSTFPVEVDNPLNGNMYKPVYFDRGQAIHGSYNVPPEPRSKGCVRLLVEHQDQFIAWLGLHDVSRPIWDRGDIGLVVSVRGSFLPDAPTA
jgi:hypothetical protein